ncbi:type II toxin-antitoxin system RelE/ParE family toxin [Lampropedia puyangensis]|uniref:Type II toxin-antitoxin system RelE/ParE family toxin n=1 Tax=Lampropedia puyangensis TaxID=1330072 RepID=A0A4S8F2B1_9BURK|nr:type II toxin-antitoxin system RelE/ParE family toxin [Lampropedia puyangensis]THU01443.1 type II toxin-antitoxin system RelE/ParE family toxin [Lampropedia puyangensis]
MHYTVRLTPEAEEDLLRLYEFILERDLDGYETAECALTAIQKGFDFLKILPYSCRKADVSRPYLRELVISFGASGYVALFEIEPDQIVTIIAVRHQRESDFH